MSRYRFLLKCTPLFGLLAWLLASAASAQPPGQEGPQATPVRTAEVKLETLQEKTYVTGSLQALNRAEIAAKEEGLVVEILVDEGSTVEKGDLLVQVDDRRLTAQLQEARSQQEVLAAQLEGLEAELENATWNRDRVASLVENEMTTEREYRQYATAVQKAKSAIAANKRSREQLNNRIQLLQIRLEDTQIRAPFDGEVIARDVELGEWILPGQVVLTLVSMDPIEAWLSAPERYANEVTAHAQQIEVQLENGDESMTSEELRVIADVDPRARTFWLVATLLNNERFLLPGMSVTSWIPTGDEVEQLTVHKNALIRDQAGAFVYKAQMDGEGNAMAVQVPLRILFESKEKAAVSTDLLKPGDQVVVEGNERLRPMMPLQIVDSPEIPLSE